MHTKLFLSLSSDFIALQLNVKTRQMYFVIWCPRPIYGYALQRADMDGSNIQTMEFVQTYNSGDLIDISLDKETGYVHFL